MMKSASFTDQMVMNLADWETFPYDSFSPHQDIISSRLSTLYQLPTMQRGVLIVPVNTLMQRVCPHSFLHGHALVMKKGQRLSRDALRTQLDSAGYRHVDQVMEHGEYATRGALLDLFPMGSGLFLIVLISLMMKWTSLRVFDVDGAAGGSRSDRYCCPRTNFRPIKRQLNCSAASGAIPSK